MYRHSLLLALGITAFVMSPFGVAGTRTESARATAATLKKVTSSLDPRTGLLTIEASAPVPYVASQVDARTTLVEMRDVVIDKDAARVRIDRRHPIGRGCLSRSQTPSEQDEQQRRQHEHHVLPRRPRWAPYPLGASPPSSRRPTAHAASSA